MGTYIPLEEMTLLPLMVLQEKPGTVLMFLQAQVMILFPLMAIQAVTTTQVLFMQAQVMILFPSLENHNSIVDIYGEEMEMILLIYQVEQLIQMEIPQDMKCMYMAKVGMII